MNIETANRLLYYRKKNNLSQEELAAKIGVSRQAVSKWERAEASPDTDNLILLAKLYGVSLDELLMSGETECEEKSSADSNETARCTDRACGDEVNFKNGIHIRAKNGDKVDIGFSGIHVNSSKGEKVDVDHNGVFVTDSDGRQRVVTDEDGHIFVDKKDEYKQRKEKLRFWYIFPFPIIVIIAYFVTGFIFGWTVNWIMFLTIPIYYSVLDAIVKRKAEHFAYPVFVAAVYLFIGMVFSLWHPGWVIFLTIPVYYCLCDTVKQFKKYKNKDTTE